MKHIIYILIGLLIFNCARMPRYRANDHHPITDARQIEGEYKNFDNDSLELHYRSLNGRINWSPKRIDKTQFTSVKFEVLNEKQLKLVFVKGDTILKSQIITYRLRNNGFMKLRNRNFRISGIPYVIGEYEICKYQLGLTKTNNLILHGYTERSGGLLIILMSGKTFKVNQTFERLK